jgi:hypothetical protein
MTARPAATLLALVLMPSCGAEMDAEPSMAPPPAEQEMKRADSGRAGGAPGGGARPKMTGNRAAREEMAPAAPMAEGTVMADMDDAAAPMKKAEEPADEAEKDRAQSGDDEAPATRAWFPETFLWRPLVITDEAGLATVNFTVPDTLTTWRVLGLAASRDGAQSGSVTSFMSTLPVYVDPVVPEKLRLGDRVFLPVQVVNTTEESVSGLLTVEGLGLTASGAGQVTVGPGGAIVERVTAVAAQPGPGRLAVRFASADAAVKELVIEPTGRPNAQSRGGLLVGAASMDLATPANTEHAELRVTLHPGPLGLLRAELDRSAGASAYDAPFTFALGVDGAATLTALGAAPDEAAVASLRSARIRGYQSLVRQLREVGPDQALAVAMISRAPETDELAWRLAEVSRQRLAEVQRPDGSWTVPQGSTVQRLLVTTASCAWAVNETGSRVLAAGAVERLYDVAFAPEVADAYTAAWVLRAGLADSATAEALRAIVKDAVSVGGDGLAKVTLPAGVVGPDGRPPQEAEVLALAALALEGDERPALLAALMSAWAPGRGFGGPAASVAALDALKLSSLGTKPESMAVVLKIDGVEVTRHTLRAEAVGEVVVLRAPAPKVGEHHYELVADGAWPGLAYRVDLTAWTPWTGETGSSGLRVMVGHDELSVGDPAQITMTVSGPESQSLLVEHRPPVGFRLDGSTLTGGTLVRADDESIVARVTVGPSGLAYAQRDRHADLGRHPVHRGDLGELRVQPQRHRRHPADPVDG